MATTRGFVERIEAGRAGLVTVTLVGPAGRQAFTISDIDGDPERFNERLTKIALLRDAMNRAEPVEVENDGGTAGGEIDRAARITRDSLVDGTSLWLLGGLVLRVAVESQNASAGPGESHDLARVDLLAVAGSTSQVVLDLQGPERAVAAEQLRLLRTAHETGAVLQCLVADPPAGGAPEILTVWLGESGLGQGKEEGSCIVSGFVETLGLLHPTDSSAGAESLALTRLTTGPELSGPGGTVDPAPFAPALLALLVARGSVPYALLEAALRENLRVRVRYAAPTSELKDRPDDAGEFHRADDAPALVRRAAYVEMGAGRQGDDGDAKPEPVTGLVLGVELQAPLASASRPVWVHIDREMLDRGPDADCVPGLPSTSLQVRSLRDLRIPYPAEWLGQGCFNHGVYRFQLLAPAGSTLAVDGQELCLFASGDEADTLVAYACLEGDHVVRVQIPEYVCDTAFDLDAYRVR